MTREVKSPEVRREEFLDTAETLFLERGYDSTTVSDIVTTMGLAKGAFYHYFGSKEDILTAIIERLVDTVTLAFVERCEDEGVDAPAKLKTFYGLFMRTSSNELVDIVHDERNAHIHFRLSRRIEARTVPILTRIVEQGMSEGAFRVRHPEEAASVVFHIASLVDKGNGRDAKEAEERLIAVKELTEGVLRTEPGTFDGLLELTDFIDGM